MNKKGQTFEFVLFVLIMIGIIIFAFMERNGFCQYEEDVTNIYSLNMGKELQGSFFIGIGNFGSSTYYYFYKEDGEGVILDKLNAEYVRLIETNERPPSYVEYSCSCIFKKCDGTKKRTLFIPIGTIKTNYDVNTKSLQAS